jgi:hypothetical protein
MHRKPCPESLNVFISQSSFVVRIIITTSNVLVKKKKIRRCGRATRRRETEEFPNIV